jgi:hypothetical protein
LSYRYTNNYTDSKLLKTENGGNKKSPDFHNKVLHFFIYDSADRSVGG